MEKSGKITLTQEDMLQYRQGTVSDRLRDFFLVLTYEELNKLILAGEYQLLP